MKNTTRGLEVEPSGRAQPYARLTDDDRRLLRLLIVALAAFTVASVIGVGIVTVDLLIRDRERQETVDALVLGEERRRINFELLTEYELCLALKVQTGRDPRRCPDPEFVPPPDEIKVVPSEIPGGGESGPSSDDGQP